MATRLGTVIAGRYRLLDVIGAGSFGEVYRAEHVGLGKLVAVKLLQAQHAQDRQLVRRFQDEARRAAGLKHPGIIEIHDVGVTEDGRPYQVMDFLTGISLAEELRAHRQLPIGRAVALAMQVLDALSVAHAAGIVHRDVKPENLFLERDARGEQLKILDFGIAKMLETAGGPGGTSGPPMTAAGRPLGTPYYMSPEQAIDAGRVGPRADVYSVGATLFEMLTGRTVVLPAELVVVIGHVIAGHIERHPRVLRAEVPAWLDEIVARALAQRPEQRHADAADLLAALRAGQRGAAASQSMTGGTGRLRPASFPPAALAGLGNDEVTSAGDAATNGGDVATNGGDVATNSSDVPTRIAPGPGGFIEARTAMLSPTLAPPRPPRPAETVDPPSAPPPRARTPIGDPAAPVVPAVTAPEASAAARPRPAGARRTRLVAAGAALAGLAALAAGWWQGRHALPVEQALRPARAAAHFGRARAALDAGEARLVLEELAHAAPLGASPAGLMLDARARLLLGDLSGAAQALDLALAEGLSDREALLARAALDLARGDTRNAATRARLLYAEWPEPEVAVVYGTALLRLGDRVHARPVLQAAAAAPRGRAAFVELARLERLDGDFARAAAAYLRAIEADPRNVAVRLEAAQLAFDTGDVAGARAVIDRLLGEAPADLAVLTACARVRIAAGDVQGAHACLDLAAETPGADDDAKVLRERGRLALALAAPIAAIEPLEAAARLSPDDAEIQLLLLDAHLGAGPTGNPADLATRLEQRFAGQAAAELARGREALHRGSGHDAVRAFAFAATTLDTTDGVTPRERAAAHVWLGRAQLEVRDRKAAEASFRSAAELWPPSADAHFHLGRLALERGRVPAARDALLRATAADVNHAEAFFWLAEAYLRLGQRERALAAFDRCRDIAPDGPLAAEVRRQRKVAAAPPPSAARAPEAAPDAGRE